MLDLLRRHWLALLLAIAVLINLAIYWPRKSPMRAFPEGRPPGPPGFVNESTPDAPPRDAAFQAMLAKLPAEQRKAVEERVAAAKTFFASIKDLPEKERRQKIQEHFQQNPPPPMPGMAGGPPPGNDGRGGPGAHIPPPDVRQEMDRHIADSQRSNAAP